MTPTAAATLMATLADAVDAAHRAGVAENDPMVMRLVDAYLEAWSAYGSVAKLRRAAELGARLGSVTRALCWHRVVMLNPGVLADEPDIVSKPLANVRGAIAPDTVNAPQLGPPDR